MPASSSSPLLASQAVVPPTSAPALSFPLSAGDSLLASPPQLAASPAAVSITVHVFARAMIRAYTHRCSSQPLFVCAPVHASPTGCASGASGKRGRVVEFPLTLEEVVR